MNDIYFSKYKHDECCIEDDILLMDNANYYLNKLVCNGMLYLTKSELVFISREKKDSIKVDVPLHSIDIVSYRKIYRHIAGLAITLYDGTKLGFAVSHPENYIERISMLIDSFSSKQ